MPWIGVSGSFLLEWWGGLRTNWYRFRQKKISIFCKLNLPGQVWTSSTSALKWQTEFKHLTSSGKYLHVAIFTFPSFSSLLCPSHFVPCRAWLWWGWDSSPQRSVGNQDPPATVIQSLASHSIFVELLVSPHGDYQTSTKPKYLFETPLSCLLACLPDFCVCAQVLAPACLPPCPVCLCLWKRIGSPPRHHGLWCHCYTNDRTLFYETKTSTNLLALSFNCDVKKWMNSNMVKLNTKTITLRGFVTASFCETYHRDRKYQQSTGAQYHWLKLWQLSGS